MQVFNRVMTNLTATHYDPVTRARRVEGFDGDAFTARDRIAFSRFKYGWLPPATTYGNRLADLTVDQLARVSRGRRVYIVSAPYKYLPTASHAIAQQLCRNLSLRAHRAGFEPPVLLPFHKDKAGDSSYAKGGMDVRLATLSGLSLHIDESLVRDNVIVVVDDIRMTGSAECKTAEYLESLGPYAMFYLHAFRMVEAKARAYPHLEDELNQTVEHPLNRFHQEWLAGEFQLNTRALRHILDADDDEFWDFILKVPEVFLDEIIYAAIGTGRAYSQHYSVQLQLLIRERERRNQRKVQHV